MFQKDYTGKGKSLYDWCFRAQTNRTDISKKNRCGYQDHIIAKFPKSPKDNYKRRNQVSYNEKGNRECDNDENNSDQKIYAYLARISDNDSCPSGNFDDNSQLTN